MSINKGKAHVSCIKYENLNNISHYHSDHELVYINKGSATVLISENIFNLGAGDAVFIHGSEIHYIRSDERTVITVLKAESIFFENIFSSKRLLSPLIGNATAFEGILNEIAAELFSNADNCNVMADSIAAQLFIKILRNEQTVSRESADTDKNNAMRLYNVISKKISDEYDTLTFEEAADYMHFSGPYFSKIFHNIFGMTFTRYLSTVRVAAAIKKLRDGDMSITEISASCGFNTIRNFNRVFKSFTGYTPNSIPPDYVFLYSLQDGYGLDPTLNCTVILD